MIFAYTVDIYNYIYLDFIWCINTHTQKHTLQRLPEHEGLEFKQPLTGSRDDVLEPSVYDLARESARVEGTAWRWYVLVIGLLGVDGEE